MVLKEQILKEMVKLLDIDIKRDIYHSNKDGGWGSIEIKSVLAKHMNHV